MAVKVIEEFDAIKVDFVPILIFSGPGVGKSTLLQTADRPLTLDFDRGAHRCRNRKTFLQFDRFKDNIEAAGRHGEYRFPEGHSKAGQLIDYQTLGGDTGGRILDAIEQEVIIESPAKNPWAYGGRLTPTGWGELGSRFRGWLKLIRSWGKDLVFLCHQESSKDSAGNATYAPDLQGNMAWKEIHKCFDLIGRIRYDGTQRILDFNPSEFSPCCKNACQWEPMPIPDLHKDTTFLAKLIADAKDRLGRLSEASAVAARQVAAWHEWLEGNPSLSELNARLPEIKAMPKAVGVQCWKMTEAKAAAYELAFDKDAKQFAAKPEEGGADGA